MAIWDALDWAAVRQLYDDRTKAHLNLVSLHQGKQVGKFANWALGISDPAGNYSAVEHGLGPKILGTNLNAEKKVFDLATKFLALDNARTVPAIIRSAQIKYLQIGVGSEISCMVNPKVCWVANSRTIWTHLVVKHADNIAKADEELKLYRQADVTSEMDYQNWSAIHAELDVALTRISEIGRTLSKSAGIPPGDISYLWADAIASFLYGAYHGE
jgi:hypothetical protein